MQVPLSISFRHVDPSPTVEDMIRDRAGKLEKFCDDIIRCNVVIEAPHKHARKGNLYRIGIDVTVPGKELVAKRSPDADHSHEDIYVAVHEAFDVMQRQLEDYVRIRRGKVKRHGAPRHHNAPSMLETETAAARARHQR